MMEISFLENFCCYTFFNGIFVVGCDFNSIPMEEAIATANENDYYFFSDYALPH